MARPAAVSAPKAVPSPGTATAPAAPQPAGGGRGTVAAGTVLSSALGLVWGVTPNLSAKTPVKETWKSPEPHSKHLSALAPTPGSHSILGVLWLTSTSSLALSAARRAYPAGISHPRNLENWVMR